MQCWVGIEWLLDKLMINGKCGSVVCERKEHDWLSFILFYCYLFFLLCIVFVIFFVVSVLCFVSHVKSRLIQ